jgi:phosphoglycerate dehydrogenase-like enzyme
MKTTLAIIGCGRIGSKVAEMAKALGMRVVAYSRRSVPAHVAENADLPNLLATADVISLHCPSTPETRNLLDAPAFAQMKDGAMLINTARGAVVDHDALADALRSGKLAGAGLDVFPEEPRIPAELLAMDNVVCTPHIGSNTAQTRADMATACARQILDALAGKRPENIVNGI